MFSGSFEIDPTNLFVTSRKLLERSPVLVEMLTAQLNIRKILHKINQNH